MDAADQEKIEASSKNELPQPTGQAPAAGHPGQPWAWRGRGGPAPCGWGVWRPPGPPLQGRAAAALVRALSSLRQVLVSREQARPPGALDEKELIEKM